MGSRNEQDEIYVRDSGRRGEGLWKGVGLKVSGRWHCLYLEIVWFALRDRHSVFL